MTNRILRSSAQEKNRPQPVPGWALIGLFVLIALSLVIGGILFFRHQTQLIRAQQIDDLQTIAELKTDQFVQWRLERLGDVKSNTSNPFMRKAVIEWAANPNDTALRSDLLTTMQLLVDVYREVEIVAYLRGVCLVLVLHPLCCPAPAAAAHQQPSCQHQQVISREKKVVRYYSFTTAA
jgi:hypothetical protein